MKQIYYTQCPIGYGLGASNGFQIKRLSPGYAVSGDFRHFSLRAFVAGTRQPAPAVLRYRRGEGDVAEVAWLTPRSHEYETERGLWGRPGGHFAHGLQLDEAELHALCDWPAGLFDGPFWTRTDRTPSRGQPPAELALSAADLTRPPTFAAVAPLALAAGADADSLARLLTALAAAAAAGRTLFLIDEAERLPPLIALLTFAFPAPWRAALTFSTYHDRPEELPGFRIQGTIPAARPNRAALLAQGFIADGAAGTMAVEPGVEPAGWARTLAGWLIHHEEANQADWESTRSRAMRAHPGAGGLWDADWLERMFALPRVLREPAPALGDAGRWSPQVDWPSWTRASGLAAEWAAARPPRWWRTAAPDHGSPQTQPAIESRAALIEQLRLPEAWQEEGRAESWGGLFARWVGSGDEAERLKAIGAALSAAPPDARPSFAAALIRGLPPAAASPTLSWLAAQTAWDRSMLLPLQAHGAAVQALEARDSRELHALFGQSLDLPGALPAVLGALEADVRDQPEARAVLAEQLALTLGLSTAPPELRGVVAFHQWALSLREDETAIAWLAPYWGRLFADRLNIDAWRTVIQHLPRALAPRFLPILLRIATGSRAVEEAFRWGIEELVLPLPEAERPHDPAWPGAYLDRLPSGLDLLRRLVKKPYQRLGVRRWLDQARAAGALATAQAARLDDCERYERVLRSGDAKALLEMKLPDVPPDERGLLLSQILRHLGDGSDEAISLALDSCRAAWPAGFTAGAAGLAPLAEALAVPLLAERGYPENWLERLERILGRLDLAAPSWDGFAPEGLAALLLAATTRHVSPDTAFDPWRLRKVVLHNDRAWRALAADIGRDLAGVPAEASVKVLDQWEQALDKGLHTKRFYELWFNVCDPMQLVAAVASRAADTRNFVIPWWQAARQGLAAFDIRERLVREAPMVPLRQGSVAVVLNWLRRKVSRPAGSAPDELVPIEQEGPLQGAYAWLISEEGRSRWKFLEELSQLSMAGTAAARRERLMSWNKQLPLKRLAAADRYLLLASIIRHLDEDDPALIACLAKWLFQGGVWDVDQIKCWHQTLSIIDPVPDELVLMRVALVRRLCDELNTLRREEKQRGRKPSNSGSP